MKAYQAGLAQFEANDTQVFGVSVDSVPATKRFAQDIGVTFPLLSDFKRTGGRDHGVFNESQRFGNRGTFVIARDGIIQVIDENLASVDPLGAADVGNRL